ncbi:MAG: cytochrome c3 family protein [Bacteroidota bacterium]|nr:cytochrome c3 family protein [Bacteroidota bacterium]
MKPKYFYLTLVIAVAAFLAFNAFTSEEGNKKGNRNEKIIKFSHRVHAELTDCQSCHSKAAESKSLGNDLFPSHPDCASCHDVEDKDNCKMCHYEGVYESLTPKKSNLIFNHSFHISKEKLDCKKCHQGLEEVDYGYKAKMAVPPMSLCNDCHNNFKGIASNQCEACHISTVNLIPASHQTVDFRRTHKFAAQKDNANCNMCHDNSSCQECHVATNVLTEKNTPTDFYTPYVPSNSPLSNGAKKQQITRVHDLNYVYTHGIDLKGKTTECQTCHETESFCVPCHNDRQADFNLAGVMPASHKVPNFVTIGGYGSGGGEHARQARRDIESCQSCHDVQGSDPNCIQCHIDNDGIKGTNPKTHPNNFMRDVHGDWHDSQGSVCYNCHTSASPSSQPGVGFCGYCHTNKH